MKTDFDARPVFLHRDDRIKAHFLTCFLSLILYKYLEKKINIRVSKKIFDLNPNLVGMGTKGTPSYKEKEISKETREKLSKVNKGKKHKESTKQLISIKACERKGLYLWVNNPNTNEKTKIKKEIASNFLKENPEWKLGKGKNKKESNEK